MVNRTLVIAEPGCTHEGDVATLNTLLMTAHQCGADVFKPGWVSDPALMCERRHIGLDHPKRAYYERAYGWLSFPAKLHEALAFECHARGMQYAVSVYLPQDVATVAPYADILKISSFEAGDTDFLRVAMRGHVRHVRPANQLIVSLGMNGEWPFPNYNASTLLCVSSYPAPIEAMNLRRMAEKTEPHKMFPYHGLSDHSRHLLTGAVAVGAGAEIIETHFRLDECDPANPDYAVSFSPAEFAQYIRNIRDAEKMLGSGEKTIQPCEQWAVPYKVTNGRH